MDLNTWIQNSITVFVNYELVKKQTVLTKKRVYCLYVVWNFLSGLK